MSDLQAAAERVRRIKDGEPSTEVYRDRLRAEGFAGMESVGDAWYEADVHALADAYLQLTDPTPVDEAWLRSLGFLPGDEVPVELALTIYGVGVYDDEEPHMHITWSSNDGCFWLEAYAANGDSLCVVEIGRKTRGQLNSLLRAIRGSDE